MKVPEATKLSVQAVGLDEAGPFRGRSCYSVSDHKGLWRRVSRQGRTGLKTGEDHVVAVLGESLIELARWEAAEQELMDTLPADGGKPW